MMCKGACGWLCDACGGERRATTRNAVWETVVCAARPWGPYYTRRALHRAEPGVGRVTARVAPRGVHKRARATASRGQGDRQQRAGRPPAGRATASRGQGDRQRAGRPPAGRATARVAPTLSGWAHRTARGGDSSGPSTLTGGPMGGHRLLVHVKSGTMILEHLPSEAQHHSA
jgi:hypothetical protein